MTDRHRPLAAALWMSGSIAGFCLVAVAGRALRESLDTFEVMLWRSLVGIVAVVAFAAATGRMGEITTHRLGTQGLRNLLHFAGQNLWLYALPLIPLAQLFALEFSYPLIVALLAPVFLSEPLTRAKMVAALLGFAGVLIVARPFGAAGLSLGLLAALACAFGFAGAALVTKRLTRAVGVTCILFWLTVMQSLFGLALAGADGAIALPPSAALPWVMAIGLGGLGAHLCLTMALSLAPATVVTPIDFLRLPLVGVIGMVVYGEPLDLWVFAGGAVILAANLANIRAQTRLPALTRGHGPKDAPAGFSTGTQRH
jgi:drug/metabolite transporter (DMT)-like permease